MKALRYLLVFAVLLVATGCANLSVGGGVSGGSSGDVDVGVGVGIHLLNE
jgi:hypothetical protein